MPEAASKSVEDLWRQIVSQKAYFQKNQKVPDLVVLHHEDWYDLLLNAPSAIQFLSLDGKKQIMGLTVYLSSDVEIGKPVVA